MTAALLLTLYNVWDAQRAAEYAEKLTRQISRSIESQAALSALEKAIAPSTAPGEAPAPADTLGNELPTVEIEGNQYIGILSIPALALSLPVMSDWSDEGLRLSPCRYSGSADQGDLIVAAHNYPGHFGSLKKLAVGDEVIFTDTGGNRFDYVVTELVQLDGGAVKEMKAGEWDLTLFTCTTGGESRVTVRCKQCSGLENGMADEK